MVVQTILKGLKPVVVGVRARGDGLQDVIGDLSLMTDGRQCVDAALADLLAQPSIHEAVILQKCNAVEFYVLTNDAVEGQRAVHEVWRRHARNYREDVMHANARTKHGPHVVEHLLRTVSGLESVVIGDSQVRGQVWDAYMAGKRLGATGVYFDTLFKYAKETDAQVRAATGLDRGNTSVERSAVEYIHAHARPDATIGILGGGKTGRLVAKALHEHGFNALRLFSRSPTTVDAVSACALHSYTELAERLPSLDVVVAGTEHNGFLLGPNDFASKTTPTIVIDISSPAVIDPDVASDRVTLMGTSDIESLASRVREERSEAAAGARTLIGRATKAFDANLAPRLVESSIHSGIRAADKPPVVNADMLRLRSAMTRAARRRLSEEGYVEAATPLVTAVPVEVDAAHAFQIDWYGARGHLRASNQYYKSLMIASGLNRTYEIGPFWRNLRTVPRDSLCEAWAVDVELRAERVRDVQDELRQTVQAMLAAVHDEESLLRRYGSRLHLPRQDLHLPCISTERAQELLEGQGIRADARDALGVFAPQLSLAVEEETGSPIYFVDGLPEDPAAFYVRNEGGRSTRFLLMYDAWQVATGSLRETDPGQLRDNLKAAGRNPKGYKMYLKLYEHDVVPSHGGFGLGLERLMARVVGFDDVGRVTPFPRRPAQLLP